ncbi:uncharacterized protein N7487_011549 [Penicillium crustosum]|uniref:uncharacterized protein n=1 Tax=Penicillium crustosum TaxID=36656 RepID=UPI0023988202|nr:uncharacterized protein N7487_011549 [Penicillium crustosum]KAJ5393908.1 hypothetical protein N7487_011549 [Penicillium crustosum]
MLPFLFYLDWVAASRLRFGDFVEFSDQMADLHRNKLAQIQDMENSSRSPLSPCIIINLVNSCTDIVVCWKAKLLSLTVTGNAPEGQKEDETSMTRRPCAVEHSAVRTTRNWRCQRQN